MKYIIQIIIIFSISAAGEILNYFIPLPIPASIYGMIIMFILLWSGILKLHNVRDTGYFLIEIMPMLFIPSAVGIMTEFTELKAIWWQIIIITIATTVIVMAVTGLVTQFIIRYGRKKNTEEKR